MTYDVEVLTDGGGWATDMTVAGRHGRRRALDRRRDLDRSGAIVRVRDRNGRELRVDEQGREARP